VQPILAFGEGYLEGSDAGIGLAEDYARGRRLTRPQAAEAAGRAQLFVHDRRQFGYVPSDIGRYPRDPRLDLYHAMGAAREAAEAAATAYGVPPTPSVGARPATLRQDRRVRQAVEHAANAIDEAALTTAIELDFPSVPESRRSYHESTYPQLARETYWARDATWSDFKALRRLRAGSASEPGDPLDPSEQGELGPLWPEGTPTWFQEGQWLARRARHVSRAQDPAVRRGELPAPDNGPRALLFTTGDRGNDFRTLTDVATWLEQFLWQGPAPDPRPCLVVLAAPNAGATEAHVWDRLVSEMGAVVFERREERGGFPDLDAVRRWLAPLMLSRSGASAAPHSGGSAMPLAALPPEAAMFGRQPAHVETYDPAKFQDVLQRLHTAHPWELDS
jgi:hypothetical protein